MTKTNDNQPLTELLDDWYTAWDDLSAECRQEPDDDIDPFVIR